MTTKQIQPPAPPKDIYQVECLFADSKTKTVLLKEVILTEYWSSRQQEPWPIP